MSLLAAGSILAAFFAGAVALFSPCCIVFLLPSYLASAVKGRRWALFPLTLVFAAGLALIILPLTLGVGFLSAGLGQFHTPLYLLGGLTMVGLGALAVAGRSWHLPLRSPSLERSDAGGVLALGIFSGIASSCCAPVLAGVLALSAISGTVGGSLTLGLAYVFGMVFPLFVIALAWDRLHVGDRRLFTGRTITLRFAARSVRTTTTNVAVGSMFGIMGIAIMILALVGEPMWAPGFQIALGRGLTSLFAAVLRGTSGVSQPVLGLGLLVLASGIGWAGARGARGARIRREEGNHGESITAAAGCCAQEDVD
ncbi:MAG: cytochrome c biogenesis protein CcdA [Actinomycetota bacterium]